MHVLGYSIDNISLLALTLASGFVVDDAIVMLENIVRHIEEGKKPFRPRSKGSREIGFTIVSITMSLVAVFIPVFFMGGVVGRVFREFAGDDLDRDPGVGLRVPHAHPDGVRAACCGPSAMVRRRAGSSAELMRCSAPCRTPIGHAQACAQGALRRCCS